MYIPYILCIMPPKPLVSKPFLLQGWGTRLPRPYLSTANFHVANSQLSVDCPLPRWRTPHIGAKTKCPSGETFLNGVMRVYGRIALISNFPSGELFLWSNLGCDRVRKSVRISRMWGRGLGEAKKIEKTSFFCGQIEIIYSYYMGRGSFY